MSNNKSLVCDISNDQRSLARALDETERFSREEGLDHKKALHLRLLCEELIGMVGTIVHITYGSYWIDEIKGEYQLHLEAKALMTEERRETLLDVAPDGQNAAYAGVKGKIAEFFDRMAQGGSYNMIGMVDDPAMNTQAMYNWSYQCYVENMRTQKKQLDWDQMEKSILTKLTKDIKVGVRENEVTITLIAK